MVVSFPRIIRFFNLGIYMFMTTVKRSILPMLLPFALWAQAQEPDSPTPPLAHWTFDSSDEGDGPMILDRAGNNLHAAVLAPDHVGRVEEPMPALWFDGEPVTDPALAGEGIVESEAMGDQLYETFSISLWIHPDSLPGLAPILTKTSDVDEWTDGFGVYVEDGQLRAFVNDAGDGQLTGAQARANTWTHLCLTFDGSAANYYINSRLFSTAESGNSDVFTAAPVRLGTLAEWPWHGLIADVRVYDAALSEEEVLDLFTSTPVSELVSSLAENQNIPDLWAIFHNLDPWDPTLASQVLKPDGFSVLQKYRLGMNPTKTAVVSAKPLLKVLTPLER